MKTSSQLLDEAVPSLDVDQLGASMGAPKPTSHTPIMLMIGAVVVIGGLLWWKGRASEGGLGNILPSKPVDHTIVFKQPSGQLGTYTDRSWQADACALNNKCTSLDDMTCDDGTNCLKWGANCFVGSVEVPEGTTVTSFSDFGCQSKKDTFEAGSHTFWDYNDRVCAFEIAPTDC